MKINSQLRAAYAYSFFAFCGITQLWVIYLGRMGLSLVAIGLCESVFHVASFLFEVPSGVLADRFTYRRMLTLSRIAALVSAAMMLYRGGFWWFAASFVFSAWSFNLQSGTLEALLYESLKAAGETTRWPQVTSRLNTVIEVASSGGLIVAGAMTHWHFAATYAIALGLAVLAIGAVWRLAEPPLHAQSAPHQTIKTIVTTAWRVLRHDRRLLALMVFDASFSAITTGYYYYFQSVMTARHFAGGVITALLAAAALVAILAIQLSPHLLRLSPRRVLIGLSAALALALLAAGLDAAWLLAAVYLLTYALSALLRPVFDVYYNDGIPSAQRATLLSVASLLYSVCMIVLFPLLGFAVSRFGFGATFAVSGGLVACATLVLRRR
ncbi:MFS transporter [Lacticaseibacillus kribbianus]|uniref:MFS transporter n=1 Tax=Lacticaseibacillus kribbianus TaxID=2926292 RepID=UPI001CD62596|nr:MFS transporter [Lacticaseibacillus kribbianus]